MKKKIVTLTPEQLAIRRTGVTGSEIATVAGLHPWQSPIEPYLKKIAEEEEEDENEKMTEEMETGVFLEDGIRRLIEHRLEVTIDKPGTLIHPEHPIVIATPDGIASMGNVTVAAVEIKTVGRWADKDWLEPTVASDGIPRYVIPQTIWEMAVTGTKECIVGAQSGSKLSIYNVPWNQELFELLLDAAEKFMTMVRNRRPPPVDGSGAYTRYLRKRYPEHKAQPYLVATTEMEEVLARYHGVANEIKRLEKEEQALKNRIIDWIGERPGMKSSLGKIHWRKGKDKQALDAKLMESWFREHNPHDLELFRKVKTGSRNFRPSWKEDE